MKKYFIFPSVFFLVLLFFFVFTQDSFAATVWSAGMSVGQTTATASSTALTCGPDATFCSKVGIVYSTTTGVYIVTSSDSTLNLNTTSTAFSINLTSLSRGTLYYAKAFVAATTTAGATTTAYSTNETTFLTGVAAPADLTKTDIRTDSIAMSWTAGDGAEKTMIRYGDSAYPASISSDNQAFWATGTSAAVYSLLDNKTYYFGAWSSTSDGGLTTSSDSSAQLTATTAKAASSRVLLPPVTYADSLVIQQGAATTNSREVELSLKADNVLHMSICHRSDFINCWLETYSQTKSWTLTEGDGVKTVYVKFTSPDGVNSNVVSDAITLKTEVPAVPAAPAIPAIPAAPAEPAVTPATPVTPAVPAAPAAPAAPAEKPISQMTKEELMVKITEILAQIKVLQVQLTELKEVVVFKVDLKYGARGDDVVKLQEVLIKEGLLVQGLNTGWFGPLTKAAVIKFQEKHVSEILTPWGFTKGTGLVGSTTRAKLNELVGK